MTVQDRDFDDNVYDLNAILHPETVFDHPRDVLAYPTLSREKSGPSWPRGPPTPRR